MWWGEISRLFDKEHIQMVGAQDGAEKFYAMKEPGEKCARMT